MTKNEKPVIVEQKFKIKIEKLWKLVSEVELMRQWFFDNIPDFKAEVGFNTFFEVDAGERKFIHKWKIKEVINHKKIVIDWSYEGYKGRANVVFDLEPQVEYTILKVSHIILEEFSDDIPEFRRESCKAGWGFFIKESLFDFINKKL